MSSSSSNQYSTWAHDPPPLVRWRSWPLRENPLAAAFVLAALIAAGFGVHWVTGGVLLAVFASIALTASMWRYFVPVTYELNTDGIHQWTLGRHRRAPWNEVRHYETCPGGVMLLPHAEACPIDAFRGLYLPWGDRGEEVMNQVRYYLEPAVDN